MSGFLTNRCYPLLLMVLFLLAPPVYSQDGDGSSVSPFRGTITTEVIWEAGDFPPAGKVYIGYGGLDLIITDGSLTIGPGVTVVATQTVTDLIVTGEGQLIAEGESGYPVRFTRSGGIASWGHLSFQSMSATALPSLLSNCILEYGNTRNRTGVDGYGGGLHIGYSNLQVADCIFQYNIAEWGGGLFVSSNCSPEISRSLFLSNESDNGGGGAYFWNGSASTVTNCIFDSNIAGYGTTAAYYSGGGVSLQTNASADLINCTFANNDSNHPGDGLHIHGTGGSPSAVNCIFWGSDDQLAGTGINDTRIINSAVQEYGNGTNTINLNPSNSAPDGPNFAAVDGSDWRIRFISPCRDAGTTSSAPPTDFAYTNRTGDPDIGAYEVTYSRWTGAVNNSWTNSSNWESSAYPVARTADIVIPSGVSLYPVAPGSNYELGAGKYMIIEPGADVTFKYLTNSGGTVRWESDESAMASLLFEQYYDTGSEEISLYLTGGGGPAYRWHYIAVPASISKTVFTDAEPYNLLGFDESSITDSNMEGWQWHDGYSGTTGFSTLEPKRGYNFYHISDVVIDLPSVTGLLTSMGQTVELDYNNNGLNLLGNSMLCSIDWDYVVRSGNMRNAVYFTKDNSLVAYVDGTGTPGGSTDGIIPPLQGFFVKALEPGCQIDFSNAAVNLHSDVNRLKGYTNLVPLFRLELLKDGTVEDETVIRLRNKATTSFDNEYDASRLFSGIEGKSSLSSTYEGESYVINTIPPPEDSFILPLSLTVSGTGSFSIKRTEITGFENYNIVLTDHSNNFSRELNSSSEYIFTSEEGLFNDRFTITINPLATSVRDLHLDDSPYSVWSSGNSLHIAANRDASEGSVSDIVVYDITGRTVYHQEGIILEAGNIHTFPFNSNPGLFLVEIINGTVRESLRVFHK